MNKFTVHAPKSHPRYMSNYLRDLLAWGVKEGITSLQGLTAHGRGEAFDYLLEEKTTLPAKNAIKAAAALLVQSRHPVISVNGNSAVLAGKELIALANNLSIPLEVNIFHKSIKREHKIRKHLLSLGAALVLMPGKSTDIPYIQSNRRMISPFGQKLADTVLVALEDGDRTEGLKKMGKKVIAIDLNPLSRTARRADITIVDNITRCIPLIEKKACFFQNKPPDIADRELKGYSNTKNLKLSLEFITERLKKLSRI